MSLVLAVLRECPSSEVDFLQRLVYSELHCSMGHPKKTDAEPAVEAPPTLGPQNLPGTCQHARIRTSSPAIRGYHSRLHYPDRIREGLCEKAANGGSYKIVADRQGPAPTAWRPFESLDSMLGTSFEEEERCPASCATQKIRRETAVQSSDRALGLRQRANKSDCAEALGPRRTALMNCMLCQTQAQ
jgi:hypothetical protein